MTPRPVFLSHPSSLDHDTGSHPEQAGRMVAIERELEARGWLGYDRVSSPAASREQLLRVHPERYVDSIAALAARGGGFIDMDTVASPGSFEAALHGCGGGVALVDGLLDGAFRCGFSAHRPPGHHAESSRAMGFCLFNNVAVAAAHALEGRGLRRVLVLDWDVHHGNGTNDIFHASDAVLFVSIHQSPLYPGTGRAGDVGSQAGLGYTVNLPVAPGSSDAVFQSLVSHVVVPLALAYAPQLILISAGYDAHRDDPLADCRLTEAGFAGMTASLARVCASLEAPLGCVLEGGYSLRALARSVAVTMEVMAAPERFPAPRGVAMTGPAREARSRLARWWPGLEPAGRAE